MAREAARRVGIGDTDERTRDVKAMRKKVGRVWIVWSEHGHKHGWFGHTRRSVRVRGLSVGVLPLRRNAVEDDE